MMCQYFSIVPFALLSSNLKLSAKDCFNAFCCSHLLFALKYLLDSQVWSFKMTGSRHWNLTLHLHQSHVSDFKDYWRVRESEHEHNLCIWHNFVWHVSGQWILFYCILFYGTVYALGLGSAQEESMTEVSSAGSSNPEGGLGSAQEGDSQESLSEVSSTDRSNTSG